MGKAKTVHYPCGGDYLTLVGIRQESEKEYEKRMAANERAKILAKGRRRKKKIKDILGEKKMYEKLKKKFEQQAGS